MGALFLLAIFIMLIGFKKLKREKLEKHRAMETVHQWTKKVIIVKPSLDEVDGSDGLQIPIVRIEKQRTTVHQSQYSNDPSALNEYEFPLDSNWEFPRNHLKFGPTLGEGAFGRVVMAEAYGLEKPQQSQIVAVKMVKEGHTDADITGLVREMEVMKMIGKHINIINLLGCCSQDGPLYVIVEYAPYGNLKDFLKKNLAMADYNSLNTQHVLTQKQLTSFAYQVARGMEYLASRRVRTLSFELFSPRFVNLFSNFSIFIVIWRHGMYSFAMITSSKLPISVWQEMSKNRITIENAPMDDCQSNGWLRNR